MNQVSTRLRRRHEIVALALCAVAALPATARTVAFEAEVDGTLHTATVPVVDVQGVPYVSLPALVARFEGAANIHPAHVEAQVADQAIVVGINDTRVQTADSVFGVAYPVVRYEDDVLVAQTDVARLFSQGFGVAVLGTAPAATLPESPKSEASVRVLPAPATPPMPAPTEPPGQEAPREQEPGAPPPREAPPEIEEPVAELLAPEVTVEQAPPAAEPSPPPAPASDTVAGGPFSLDIDTVIIDAGHGGHDAGCVGQSGLTEKDVALAVALRLRDILKEDTSLKIFMTRSEDRAVTPQARCRFANRNEGDLLISIHAGASFSPQAHGVDVFYPGAADLGAADGRHSLEARSRALRSRHSAEAIGAAGGEVTQANSGVVREASLRLFRGCAMPGVLVEVGFLTNPAEEDLLKTDAYRAKVARAIAAGLIQAMNKSEAQGGAA